MESNDYSTLTCTTNMEWRNAQGIVQRKVTYKTALLRIIRNEHRQMLVEVSANKSVPIRLQLKGISVHKKFMNEGKASIEFKDDSCILYISNAPPAQLLGYLKTMFIKMTGNAPQPTSTSLRNQLLSNKPKHYDEISPITISDLENVQRKVSKATDTTPSPLSRKRKLENTDKVKPNLKRLYSSSPLLNEPLNIEQKEVLDACLAGVNVFFTGSAGTGKSYLLKQIIGALPPEVTIATASTGVAACHIGGITLHQFAGIGAGDATLERSFQLASKPATAAIWKKCKHLVIDEVSMIDGEYFEKIEAIGRMIRKSDKPFGGIQLILCGDFFQLPPVRKHENSNKLSSKKFCFQTPVWDKCIQNCFELTQVHRQTDATFVDILNSIRIGKITEETTQKLMLTAKQKIEKNGILATRLCSHTNDADVINESKLNALPGASRVFEAQDSNLYLSKQLDQQTPVASKVLLKTGAQVMLLKNINISAGLVNGARGVVKEFKDDLPIIRMMNNKEYVAKYEKWSVKTAGGTVIFRKQVPLKLAWAFSIHKSQGLTLDCVEMSLAKVFEAGQAYVALSRAQSLTTLRVLDFKSSQVWANPDVLTFYNKLKRNIEQTRFIPLGRKNVNKSSLQIKKKRVINKKLFIDKPLVTIG